MNLIITNSYTHVSGSEHAQFLCAHALRYMPPASQIILQRAKDSKWDGYKTLHDKRKKRFPAGLTQLVSQYLDSIGCGYTIKDARVKPSSPKYPVELHGIVLRDYQEQSVEKFLERKRGILKLATGAGKTEVAIAIAKAISRPTIFLTHRINLLYQSARRFAERWPECKNSIGIIGDGNFDIKPITFATVQTLHGAMKKYGKNLTEDLEKFELLIVDEAHRIGAKQFNETAGAMTGAYWRLGLTATPFMSGNTGDSLHLLGGVGGIINEVTATTLIERGVLARPYFKFHVITDHTGGKISALKDWRDVYELGIVKNTFRNKVIADNTAGLVRMGYKPLVIVQQIEHGKLLLDAIEALGVSASMATGKNDLTAREGALRGLSSGKVQAIICSNIFDEGVDVKDVSAIVLAAGTKSPPALFQRTGRAIRKKDDGGNAIIIDFIDKQHKTLERHSLLRYAMVKSESGFSIM